MCTITISYTLTHTLNVTSPYSLPSPINTHTPDKVNIHTSLLLICICVCWCLCLCSSVLWHLPGPVRWGYGKGEGINVGKSLSVWQGPGDGRKRNGHVGWCHYSPERRSRCTSLWTRRGLSSMVTWGRLCWKNSTSRQRLTVNVFNTHQQCWEKSRPRSTTISRDSTGLEEHMKEEIIILDTAASRASLWFQDLGKRAWASWLSVSCPVCKHSTLKHVGEDCHIKRYQGHGAGQWR